MRSILTIGILAGLSACNSYDPSLGLTPFKCGVEEPRCPDGYTCVESSPGQEICLNNSQNPEDLVDGGDGVFTCNDDASLEPNNDGNTATPTGIPDQPSQRFVGLAICPATDTDVFSFNVVGEVTVSIVVEVGSGDGELTVDMLEAGGEPVGGPATPDLADPDKLVKTVTAVPSGQYYVRVVSDGVGQNNYNIEVSIE